MNPSTRTLLRVAAAAGAVAAITYLALAPVPRRDTLSPQRPWTDYRDASFRRAEATLQRADPDMLVRSAVASLQKRDFRRLLAHCTPRIQQRFTPESLAERFDENAFPSVARVIAFGDPIPHASNTLSFDVYYQHRDTIVPFRWRVSRDDDKPALWRVASIGPAPTRDPRPMQDARNEP